MSRAGVGRASWWQSHLEATAAGHVRHGKGARVGLDHTARDGQAEPGTAVIRCAVRGPAPADLEKLGQVPFGDATASVDDGAVHPSVVLSGGQQPDLATSRGVPNSVGQQVGQGPGQLIGVARHPKAVVTGCVDDDGDLAGAGEIVKQCRDVIDQLPRGHHRRRRTQ